MNKRMNQSAVLFANEAFYHAISHRDFEAMQALWARTWPVICIHPGWASLTEHAAVLDSWRRILQNPATGAVIPHHARALMFDSFSTVVCYEEVQGSLLVANNGFLVEGDAIKIFSHHSSPCANPPEPEPKVATAMQ